MFGIVVQHFMYDTRKGAYSSFINEIFYSVASLGSVIFLAPFSCPDQTLSLSLSFQPWQFQAIGLGVKTGIVCQLSTQTTATIWPPPTRTTFKMKEGRKEGNKWDVARRLASEDLEVELRMKVRNGGLNCEHCCEGCCLYKNSVEMKTTTIITKRRKRQCVGGEMETCSLVQYLVWLWLTCLSYRCYNK